MAKVLQQSDGVISFDIFINGSKIKDVVEVIEISIQMEVNKIASATILIEDGGAIGVVNNPFTNSEGTDFIPGNEIEISLGYDNSRKSAFKGIITSQGLMVKNGRSQLQITCKDKAVSMTKGRFNAIFQNGKDSDAIKTIAGKYGLPLTIDATVPELPVLMQYNCSDWDFVVIRSEMNNMAVLTDKNSLIIKKTDFGSSPKFEINASQFIIDIDLLLDSEDLADSYKLTAWDVKTQAKIETTVSLSDDLSQGNITADKLSQAAANGDSNLYSSASLSNIELKIWGESLANKAVLSKIQGKISVPGTTEIIAGDIINLSGFSSRFNGKAYISKINHLLTDGNWITTLHVGKSAQLHSSLPDVEDIMASGLLPASNGAQIAKVKKIDEDPDGNYRVLVNLPSFSGTGQDDGLWARLAFPYATKDAGFFFFPEVGDEVLLTFINNDPRHAVITGALYNAINKPKEIPDAKNQFKSIYSRTGINIRFDDEDKIITIETPGKNVFVMDDKNKSISVKDISGNSVLMNDSGISMESPKDIIIKATGNVNISATSGISLKSDSDVKVDGLNIVNNAKVGFTAKGNASAEISASGQTTVKGAMVMIN
ncbi:MAG TPA: Rhs element Vgr protein [Prolixibacteraceae bacterium]|nr:Rhs element Vgr protein [Prolixibacteraceae bacterium]